jgi:hypothetical protein
MRIHYAVSGGLAYFPGLAKPATLDLADLPDAVADEVRRLVDAARFFDLPRRVGAAPKGAADLQQHTLTIEDGQRVHTVQIVEPVTQPELAALLEKVQTYLRESRRSKST